MMELLDTDTITGLVLAIGWFILSAVIIALFVKLYPQSGAAFLFLVTLSSAVFALRVFIAIEGKLK